MLKSIFSKKINGYFIYDSNLESYQYISNKNKTNISSLYFIIFFYFSLMVTLPHFFNPKFSFLIIPMGLFAFTFQMIKFIKSPIVFDIDYFFKNQYPLVLSEDLKALLINMSNFYKNEPEFIRKKFESMIQKEIVLNKNYDLLNLIENNNENEFYSFRNFYQLFLFLNKDIDENIFISNLNNFNNKNILELFKISSSYNNLSYSAIEFELNEIINNNGDNEKRELFINKILKNITC